MDQDESSEPPDLRFDRHAGHRRDLTDSLLRFCVQHANGRKATSPGTPSPWERGAEPDAPVLTEHGRGGGGDRHITPGRFSGYGRCCPRNPSTSCSNGQRSRCVTRVDLGGEAIADAATRAVSLAARRMT